ncbi:hypothetical protein HJC23_008300 [Cyclotella cryptica]|uniref:Pre-rRNA-processing protein TSR2 n=1 Tax=Cyclotella cryptica TaxID=29204 RepID=A0ABD3Q4M7_9STRA
MSAIDLANNTTVNPYLEFQAGVTATLRSWSALSTAVQHEWGGSESSSKADDLRANIFTFFDGSSPNPKMTQEELEDNLLSYMEEEFGVVLEDNSEREIADLICRMYQQCGRGECVLVREVVANAMKAEEQLKQQNLKSLIQSGDADMDESSDEEGEEENDDEMETAPEEQQPTSLEEYVNRNLFGGPSKPKKELPPPRQLGEPEPQKPQPKIDDDGFAMVPTRKGSRR